MSDILERRYLDGDPDPDLAEARKALRTLVILRTSLFSRLCIFSVFVTAMTATVQKVSQLAEALPFLPFVSGLVAGGAACAKGLALDSCLQERLKRFARIREEDMVFLLEECLETVDSNDRKRLAVLAVIAHNCKHGGNSHSLHCPAN